MYVTCEELGKTLEISVRFFKEGNWAPDESNDLLSDCVIMTAQILVQQTLKA